MITEEWRMHSQLFGSWGFAAFPLIIALMTGSTMYALVRLGFDAGLLQEGLHYVVFFFGLNVGTIGFVSREAIENLLGEASLLIFSARTLPLSQRRILATFLLKDLLYYSGLFILPLVAGLVPVGAVAGVPLANPFLLWATVTGAFMLGVALSFAGASLYLRGRTAVMLAAAGLAAVVAWLGTGAVRFTPLAAFREPTLLNATTGFLPIAVLAYLGILIFRPHSHRRVRTATDQFSRLRDLLWFDDTGLVTKLVLDVKRSSGGFGKLFLSEGVVFAVFLVLVDGVPLLERFLAAPALGFAVILAMGSMAVYGWMNRFDSGENYRKFPLSMGDVFRGKMVAYLAVSLPVSYVFLLAAAYRFGTVGLPAGVLILPLVSLYLFGITVFLTGLDTDQMLFDSRVFVVFTVLASIVVVPLFIASLLYLRFPELAPSFAVLFSLLAAYFGYLFFRMAGPRWEQRLTAG